MSRTSAGTSEVSPACWPQHLQGLGMRSIYVYRPTESMPWQSTPGNLEMWSGPCHETLQSPIAPGLSTVLHALTAYLWYAPIYSFLACPLPLSTYFTLKTVQKLPKQTNWGIDVHSTGHAMRSQIYIRRLQ